MKFIFAVISICCLLISCGQDQEKIADDKGSPAIETKSKNAHLQILAPREGSITAPDPFAGFLSTAASQAYFKSISPTDSMWRYKNPIPTYSENGEYTFTEGYLLHVDSNRIGFVTLTCDDVNYGFCNTILKNPDPEHVRISESVSGVPKQYEGFRIVREIKDNEATDYLFKLDDKGQILYVTSPSVTRPPVTITETLKNLTGYDRSLFRFDYRN